MSKSEKRLLSLLFEEGRVLDNLKFFPGEECASSDELFDAAYDAISATMSGKSEFIVPEDGADKKAIGELVNSL